MYKQCKQPDNQTTKQPNNKTTKQQDNQTTKQQDSQTTRQPNNKLCLEDITEQSESNLGQSLGITTDEQGNCLEDSTYTVWLSL